MKIFYSVNDDECRLKLNIDDRFCLFRPYEQKLIAQLCADDYWANHDGRETMWPIPFTLFENEHDDPLGRFNVWMEMEPSFWEVPTKEQIDEFMGSGGWDDEN